MLDNKDSFNNQPDNTKVNREIRPWLLQRFVERARPLPKWKLAVGKSTLSTANNQQFLRLSHSNNRLARWVVNQTKLASRISRAERFIPLPLSLGSLISRKTAVGVYDRNQILDLPWFQPNKSNGQEPADKIVFNSQEEIASDSMGRFDNKMLQPLPESTREKQITVEEKMPETYIRHLISPPIARKSAIDIVDKILGPASTKGSHARNDRSTEINYSDDSRRVVERKPSLGGRIRPTSLISYRTAVGEAVTDTSSLHGLQHGKTITRPRYNNKVDKIRTSSDKKIINELDRQPLNTLSRQSSQSTHRISLPIIPAQKNISIVNASSLENPAYSINRQKTPGTKTVPNRLEVRQARPDDANTPSLPHRAAKRPAFETTPNKAVGTSISDASKTKSVDFTSIKDFKEPTQESHTTEIPIVKKSGINVKDNAKKDANNSDSAGDSLYRKPLSIGRRIMQSLPFIKNISRKMNRPAETIPITAEHQSEVNINQLPANNPEIIHPYDEASGVKPDKDNPVVTTFSGASKTEREEDTSIPEANKTKPIDITRIKNSASVPEVDKTKPIDFTAIKDFKEPRQERYTAEIPTTKKMDTIVKDNTGKGASYAYHAKDLFYRGSPPIGQRIARSLPLMRNVSHQVHLSSKGTLATGQKQPELNIIQLSSDNLGIPHVHGISDDIRKPKTDSLLIPRLVSEKTPGIIGNKINKISVNRKSEAIYDGTRTANSELDLALTPVNKLPAAQQEGNYSQSDQSTRNIFKAQASLSGQSTQQTQAGQPSRPDVTQASATKPLDENTNMNENRPDIRALAREIYPLIRRMIVVERERQPSR